MYKRWKENKGITLISLGIVIAVLLIVSTTIILSVNDRYQAEKLDKLASDLQLLTEKTGMYYLENKQYPTKGGVEAVTVNGETVYELDLTKMDGLTLNYGSGKDADDYYTIDISSGTVYYKKGIDGIYNLVQSEQTSGIDLVKITSQPQWQTIIEGTNAMFFIEVDKTDGVSYQWYSSDTYDGEGTQIARETNSTLTIENVSSDIENYYYCVVYYDNDNDGVAEITKKSNVAKLNIEVLDSVEAGGYTGTENCKYTDTNGDIAIIPAGFTVSSIKDEENDIDETTISGGLVIYSGNVASTDFTTDSDSDEIVDAQENYNQYVWIPVENPSEEMYGTLDSTVEGIEGRKFGKLYDFGNSTDGYAESLEEVTYLNWPTEEEYSKTSYREPAYLANSSYADDSTYNTDGTNKIITQDVLVTEFNNMIVSVNKYKGFYIGRYELTGSTTTPSVVKGANPLTADASYSVNSYLRWYGLYSMCEQLELTNDKVRTTMIWGCQWDQAVKVTLNKVPNFLTNAKAYGVYSDSEKSTLGETGRMAAAYNIYDMGGNVYDWTLEARTTNYRTPRGGGYNGSSTSYPASCRSIQYPISYDSRCGSRAQLFIR